MVSMLDPESGPSPPFSVHAAVVHSIVSWNRQYWDWTMALYGKVLSPVYYKPDLVIVVQ
jgi:hypothetical protein